MIPYWEIHTFAVGPINLQIWGLLVATGIAIAILMLLYLAKKFFLSRDLVLDFTLWTIIGGFIGARLVHVFLYEPSFYLSNPWEMVKFWQGGASSLGGFVGAALTGYLFLRKRKIAIKEFLPYLDIVTVSLWLGWGIGRLGCFMIHDHPGRLSNFFLAVNFPGGARFDMGLLGSLTAFLLFTFCVLLFKKFKKISSGFLFLSSFLIYAIARFYLDFLRATDLLVSDSRYLYLTPAQWGMLAVIILTIYLISSKILKHKGKNT